MCFFYGFKNKSLPQMETTQLNWIRTIDEYKTQTHKNIIDNHHYGCWNRRAILPQLSYQMISLTEMKRERPGGTLQYSIKKLLQGKTFCNHKIKAQIRTFPQDNSQRRN